MIAGKVDTVISRGTVVIAGRRATRARKGHGQYVAPRTLRST